MAKIKKQSPLFKVGDKVLNRLQNRREVTIRNFYWNGLTWLYGFNESDMSCGEEYLVPSIDASQVQSGEIVLA